MRRDWAGARPCDRIASAVSADAAHAQAHGAYGTSAVFAVRGYDTGETVYPEPNTNLMYPRTVLPMLRAALPAGEHTLVCAVYADAGDAPQQTIPREVQDVVNSLC